MLNILIWQPILHLKRKLTKTFWSHVAASNSTNTTSALSSDLSVIATNLFGATSVTKQDVDKYLTLAIIVTVIAVRLKTLSLCQCGRIF